MRTIHHNPTGPAPAARGLLHEDPQLGIRRHTRDDGAIASTSNVTPETCGPALWLGQETGHNGGETGHNGHVRGLLLALVLIVSLPAIAKAQEAKPDAATDSDPAEMPAEPSSEEQTELPTLDQMELPSLARLLQGPAVDWIVLRNKKVIVAEPVYPRPATLDEMNKRIKAGLTGPATGKNAEKIKAARRNMYYLPITLLDGDDREFKLHMRQISEIVYYDDLILRRIDKLLDERQVAGAFELLSLITERQANWPGIPARRDRLLFTEAAVKFDAGQVEPALVLLEELHSRNPTFAGLPTELGRVTEKLIASALGIADYRRARHFLQRLKTLEPRSSVVQRSSADLQSRAAAELALANGASEKGQHAVALDHAEAAARIWPDLPELSSGYNRISQRFQRLTVGVWELPGKLSGKPASELASGPLASPADRRQRELTQAHLFRPVRVDANFVRYETPFFDEWEPTELGHQLRFHVRADRTFALAHGPVTASFLAALLARQIDPQHPGYDPRLASYVESISIPSPLEVIVGLRQVPLRPEAVFACIPPLPEQPRNGAVAADSNREPSHPATPRPQAAAPFQVSVQDAEHVVYRRVLPEPDQLTERRLAEIVERKYESYEKALQGLLRGEVLLLPRIAPSDKARLEARNEFFVLPGAIPTTHFLQFNPRSRTLANRTFRRALIYSLDRSQILEDVFLKGAKDRAGRVTAGIVPGKSYAAHPALEPHKYDVNLAASLTLAARKEIGGVQPELRLWCSGDAAQREGAQRIVAAWGKLGIAARVLDDSPESPGTLEDLGAWDIAYRETCLVEPLVELWPALTLTGSTSVEALADLPAWLRNELLNLDQAGDWEIAESTLRRLHQQLWAEVHVLPLWELTEYLAVRKTVRGLPARPLSVYQGIEQWRLEPWYAR